MNTTNERISADRSDLVRVSNLKVYFPVTKGIVLQRHVGDIKAVDDISFTIRTGETLGLVGESGCGKSTTGRSLLRLIDPTDGSVTFDDRDITSIPKREMRTLRRDMQMIFQDPYASLNPRQPVLDIIADALIEHGLITRKEKIERVQSLMETVGLNPRFMNRFPHEFSGGQRQRIGIARSIALNPRFVVCDEPIAALDVSIQAQVINLLQDLQEELKLTYLFIAHDLSVVRHISTRIAVMYLGKIVELTETEELFASPFHPYTKVLLSAVPVPNPQRERSRKRIFTTGEVPSPANKPKGCCFSTRCPYAIDCCREAEPDFREIRDDHWVACFRAEELA